MPTKKSAQEKFKENLKKYGSPPRKPVFTCTPLPSPPRELSLINLTLDSDAFK